MQAPARLTALIVLTSVAAACAFTYEDILRQLGDLEHLALQPEPGVKTQQSSSYDRASTYNAGTDTYVNWGANGDGTGFTTPGVMADITGPGIIWRIWSAKADTGRVAIYLNGSTTPLINQPFASYFDRSSPPFNNAAFVYKATDAYDSYLPIPFSQSCRITAANGWGQYYHVTYTRYPAGTQMPDFAATRTASEEAVLQAMALKFPTPRLGAYPYDSVAGQQTFVRTVQVGGGTGAASTVIRLKGTGAITMIRAQPPLTGTVDEVRTRLRELAIRIRWDGESTPSVWAPLGDFFGTAPGYNGLRTLPVSMRDNMLNSFWFMPFQREARIELLNDGAQPCSVSFTITCVPLARPITDYARFHAKWHRDAFLPTRADRDCDWTILKVNGPGRYVGVNLHVWNPNGSGYVSAKYPGSTYWWGEGDEKFFVDGEKFPSTFGTGTEDYFGYGWALPWTFFRPYHAQPLNENNQGHVSNSRFHITDNYPFQQSFEGCIEKFYGNEFPTIYAATAYWYQPAGASDAYPQVGVDQRIPYWQPTYQVASATTWTDPHASDSVALVWSTAVLNRPAGSRSNRVIDAGSAFRAQHLSLFALDGSRLSTSTGRLPSGGYVAVSAGIHGGRTAFVVAPGNTHMVR